MATGNKAFTIYDKNYDDPFDILGVKETQTFSEIEQVYKILVKHTHPDRGGNKKTFDKIKWAYGEIKKMYNAPAHDDMKRTWESADITQTETEHVMKQTLMEQGYDPDRISNQQFNTMFEQFYLPEDNNKGYGNLLANTSNGREDVKEMQQVKEFDFNKGNNGEPMAIVSGASIAGDCYELGAGQPSAFTNINKGYTDYMEAHSNQSKNRFERFIEQNNRKTFKSVEDYQAYSSGEMARELTDQEIQEQRDRERRKKMESTIKRNRQQKRDVDVEAHFNRVMNRIGSSGGQKRY